MSSGQSIIPYGTDAVYEGFWQDRDRGKILGATLTLRDSRAIPLVAALAIVVRLAGNRSWHISRFLWHMLMRSKTDDNNSAKNHRRKKQIILRNSETAGGASVGFLEIWFEDGFLRVLRQISLKDYLLFFYTLGHSIAFIALGVLASQIVLGKVVVSKIFPTCGQWVANGTTTTETTTIYREMMVNLTSDGENYVRSCYPDGGSHGLLGCDKFITQSLSFTTEEAVPCPFQKSSCLPNANSAVTFDSGNITFRQLGFNTKYGKELSYNRRSTCAILNSTTFRNTTSPKAKADPLNLRYFSFSKNNVTHQWDEFVFSYNMNYYSENYKLVNLFFPFGEGLHPAFQNTPANDVSLILMQHLGINYWYTQDDPWFTVHRALNMTGVTLGTTAATDQIYAADYFLNIIACNEQYRFCSTITNQCTDYLALLTDDILRAENYTTLIGPNTYTRKSKPMDFGMVILLLQLSQYHTAMSDSIASRGGNVLQASQKLLDGYQLHLSNKQWIIELERWFVIALTRLQLTIFNTIERPVNLDDTRTRNGWVDDNSSGLRSVLCGRIKFKDPNHTSLSTFGLIIILVFSGVLMLVSLVTRALPLLNRWRPIANWKRDEMLALLEDSTHGGGPEVSDPDVEYAYLGINEKSQSPRDQRNDELDPFQMFH